MYLCSIKASIGIPKNVKNRGVAVFRLKAPALLLQIRSHHVQHFTAHLNTFQQVTGKGRSSIGQWVLGDCASGFL